MKGHLEALKGKAGQRSTKSTDLKPKSYAGDLHRKLGVYNPIYLCTEDKFQKGSKSREKFTRAVH